MKVSHAEIGTQLNLTLEAENNEDTKSLIKLTKSLEKISASRFWFTDIPVPNSNPLTKPINLATLNINIM